MVMSMQVSKTVYIYVYGYIFVHTWCMHTDIQEHGAYSCTGARKAIHLRHVHYMCTLYKTHNSVAQYMYI